MIDHQYSSRTGVKEIIVLPVLSSFVLYMIMPDVISLRNATTKYRKKLYRHKSHLAGEVDVQQLLIGRYLDSKPMKRHK
jgi:hypothetical protein